MTAAIAPGKRPGCPAPVHDTAWAYNKHRCRCPKALAHERERHAVYRAKLPHGSRAYRNHTDVDPVAVDYAVRGERLANGQRPQLGRAERRLAVERLHRAGLKGPEIARRLGITTRSVDRHLSALRARDRSAA